MIQRASVDTTGNRFCGPLVLAAILGINTGEAAAKLRSVTGRPRIRGVYPGELRDVLTREGYTVREVFDGRYYGKRVKPTLARWLRERDSVSVNSLQIVLVTGHYMLVQGRKIVDTGSKGEWVFLRKAPHRRRRVRRVFRVTRSPKSFAQSSLVEVTNLKG